MKNFLLILIALFLTLPAAQASEHEGLCDIHFRKLLERGSLPACQLGTNKNCPAPDPEAAPFQEQLAQAREYYDELPKPMGVAEKNAISQSAVNLDRYFDKMIQSYSPETQTELKKFYYEGKGVAVKPGLLEGPHPMFANWSMQVLEGRPHFNAYIDPWIKNSILLVKLNLIHEVGVHIGQAMEQIQKSGLEAFDAEMESGGFNQFTEMTAVVAEREALASIDLEVFASDVSVNFGRPEVSREVFARYAARLVTDLRLMLKLTHRQSSLDGQVTDLDVEKFLQAFRRN